MTTLHVVQCSYHITLSSVRKKKHTLSSHTGMYYQVHFYQHLPKEEDIKLPQPILPNDHCEEKTWLHLAI